MHNLIAVVAWSLVSAAPALPDNRLVPLIALKGDTERHCTADARWCVSLEAAEGDPPLPFVSTGNVAGTPSTPPRETNSEESHSVWPNLIVSADGGLLAGVETRASTAYSGGGGSATELRLFRVAPDNTTSPELVLRVPIKAYLMIRACFGERDMVQRRGACHDEYNFSGVLRVVQGSAGGLPILDYASVATAFPRGVSRVEDSLRKGRLKKSDLVVERDKDCSFKRQFRFDAAAATYRPEVPMPDCSAYTVP